jgi:hypothetical protein
MEQYPNKNSNMPFLGILLNAQIPVANPEGLKTFQGPQFCCYEVIRARTIVEPTVGYKQLTHHL